MTQFGWEMFAEQVFCPGDDWSEDKMNSIPGTWNEKEGSWYEFRHRCSACKKEIRNEGEYTRYCPYCGKEMMFVEKVTRMEKRYLLRK